MFFIKYTGELSVNMNMHTFAFWPTSQRYVNPTLPLVNIHLIILQYHIAHYSTIFVAESLYACITAKLQLISTSLSSAHSLASVPTYL